MIKLMDGEGHGDDGTWFTGSEAVEAGFADEVIALPKGRTRAKNEIDPAERVKAALNEERRVKNANAAARLRLMEVGG